MCQEMTDSRRNNASMQNVQKRKIMQIWSDFLIIKLSSCVCVIDSNISTEYKILGIYWIFLNDDYISQLQFSVCMCCTCGRIDKADLTCVLKV